MAIGMAGACWHLKEPLHLSLQTDLALRSLMYLAANDGHSRVRTSHTKFHLQKAVQAFVGWDMLAAPRDDSVASGWPCPPPAFELAASWRPYRNPWATLSIATRVRVRWAERVC